MINSIKYSIMEDAFSNLVNKIVDTTVKKTKKEEPTKEEPTKEGETDTTKKEEPTKEGEKTKKIDVKVKNKDGLSAKKVVSDIKSGKGIIGQIAKRTLIGNIAQKGIEAAEEVGVDFSKEKSKDIPISKTLVYNKYLGLFKSYGFAKNLDKEIKLQSPLDKKKYFSFLDFMFLGNSLDPKTIGKFKIEEMKQILNSDVYTKQDIDEAIRNTIYTYPKSYDLNDLIKLIEMLVLPEIAVLDNSDFDDFQSRFTDVEFLDRVNELLPEVKVKDRILEDITFNKKEFEKFKKYLEDNYKNNPELLKKYTNILTLLFFLSHDNYTYNKKNESKFKASDLKEFKGVYDKFNSINNKTEKDKEQTKEGETTDKEQTKEEPTKEGETTDKEQTKEEPTKEGETIDSATDTSINYEEYKTKKFKINAINNFKTYMSTKYPNIKNIDTVIDKIFIKGDNDIYTLNPDSKNFNKIAEYYSKYKDEIKKAK